MGATTAGGLSIRWAIRADFELGAATWAEGWTIPRILRHLRQRNVIGMVAEDADGAVVGWMLYRLGGAGGFVRLLALAVRPDRRRQGIGAALLAKLAGKCHTHRRPVAVCTVRESDLPAQLALRSAGWVCERVIRGRFDGEDGYRFTLTTGVRWVHRRGLSVSRCGRWRVWREGERWSVADLPARVTYRQGWTTPEGAREWVERANSAG